MYCGVVTEEVHEDSVYDKMERNKLPLWLDTVFTAILYLDVNYTDHNIFMIYRNLYEYTWSYILKV